LFQLYWWHWVLVFRVLAADVFLFLPTVAAAAVNEL
jgi:hypothetical protein